MTNNDCTGAWKKSSNCANSTCVEVADTGDRCAVRDSKNPEGPVLVFGRSDWDAFIGMIVADRR